MVDSDIRLKETVLGSTEGVIIHIPLNYEEISPEVLQAAEEVIDFYTPDDFKKVLVFTLKAFEDRNEELLLRSFFGIFFLALNRNYWRSPHHTSRGLQYSTEYHMGRCAVQLSQMSHHELGWARDWTKKILHEVDWPLLENYREDLEMVYRLLSMALNVPEKDL